MKFNKLLVLGLTAIMATNAFAMPTQTEQTINQLTEQVQMLQQNNIVPKIDVNYIIKPAEEINKTRVDAMALLNVAEENCSVNIHVTPDMKISYSGTKENREFLKEVTATSNQTQDSLRMSYITYHETAHCKLHEIKDPFRAEDKKAEAALNNFFKFSASSYGSEHGDIGLYYMLHENFADTFAFMQMVKNHGVGKDVLETMQKLQIERSDAANTYNKNGLDPLVAIEDYANTIKPEAKQSLEELKTNGAEAVKNIDKLSEKLSKEAVLKNMNSIRQSSYGSTNKVHIKYGS